jgi:hypothetical protein
MKHIIVPRSQWEFSVEPFPAYRVHLSFGRHKFDKQFLPVSELSPREIVEGGVPILPENRFEIIKTKEKETTMVVLGPDTTNRVLLMVGCSGGFRGGVKLDPHTNGVVLKKAYAGNNCESKMELAAILAVGEVVVFNQCGRSIDNFIQYAWNGSEVQKSIYTKDEWCFSRPSLTLQQQIIL